jgi:two-component system OmpR family sensor kinase
MASTRARLTVSYATVLVGTLIAFSIAILAERKSLARDDLGREALRVADNVFFTLQATPQRLFAVDSTANGLVVRSTKELGDVLDPVPGYFMILDRQGRLLYTSVLMRLLSGDEQLLMLQSVLKLTDQRPGLPLFGAIVPIRNDSLRLFVVAERNPAVSQQLRVAAALPENNAELPGQLLVGSVIVFVPIIFVVSVIIAYFVVGRSFRPVEQLINEVEAITDGRSLHRRLPTDASNDELARLGVTVNAMLARLETSFAALRRFTADASHELKTPLTVLRADVERSMHPSTNRAERMIALEEALQETARMADLVDSLLTLARADEGRFDIHRQPIEIDPLVREVYETAVILGEDAGLTLTLPTHDNAIVMGDRTRLRQLLLNLVTNAIKYTPKGGRVEVSATRRPHDEIAIAVRDTGIGIAATDLPHVFDRFWRADRVRSRASERGGFGLGLSISQWIVQAHGGTLTVQSRLGRGSVFTVVLPTVAEASSSDARALTQGVVDFTNS